jgi:hypothetical protein
MPREVTTPGSLGRSLARSVLPALPRLVPLIIAVTEMETSVHIESPIKVKGSRLVGAQPFGTLHKVFHSVCLLFVCEFSGIETEVNVFVTGNAHSRSRHLCERQLRRRPRLAHHTSRAGWTDRKGTVDVGETCITRVNPI